MNNYVDFNGYNFMNADSYLNSNMNMYNNSFNNYQKDYNNLYTTYDGLIKGNLFKNLYTPYKNNEPYDIKPMNEQASMLTDIDSLCFALVDLNLYLDVYPDDKNIINLFNQYRKEKDSIIKDYEKRYGPLTLDSESLKSYPWAWNNMPWPWDK